ncbi:MULTISPECIES: hypothetical protein [unclassified Bosea (in: a-proteobacteria)]|uniref:hypothetical protein n=1 Tax=unclassified Bosea (in: a-proteobacteria) TaxID=2653178 RepID=UPI0013E07DD6|nr:MULTISPECIES: hypothetical protein [unclassified Bosea (in: a-proteobacteria)]
MTERQRQSLIDLMNSILACKCCTPDIRFRAENLLAKLHQPAGGWWERLFGARS